MITQHVWVAQNDKNQYKKKQDNIKIVDEEEYLVRFFFVINYYNEL